MKVLQYFGKNDLRFADVPEPEVTSHDVLMKVKKVGICGTDLHIYNGGMNVPTPLVMGHEFVGDIVKVGDQVTTIKVGDRAVAEHVMGCGTCTYCLAGKQNLCQTPTVIGLHKLGALSEYLVLPAHLVYKLPDALTYDEGVLVEPLSIAVYAVRKADVRVGDRVAVVGQGPIGLFVDYVASAAGGTVFGFDVVDSRLRYAQDHHYIADGYNTNDPQTVQLFKQKHDHDGVDIVFEAVGREATTALALDLARPGGKVLILGIFEHSVQVDMMQVVKKELMVHGSWTCIFSIDQTLQLLQSKKIDTTQIITHRYVFGDSIRAFQEASTDKSNRIKSVIEFS